MLPHSYSTCVVHSPALQAVSVLHNMFKKFPVLYNSSVVSSFEPKVIYKVIQKLLNYTNHENQSKTTPIITV